MPPGCSWEDSGGESKRPLCRHQHAPPPEDRASLGHARVPSVASARALCSYRDVAGGKARSPAGRPAERVLSLPAAPHLGGACTTQFGTCGIRARPRGFGRTGAPPSAPCDCYVVQPARTPLDPEGVGMRGSTRSGPEGQPWLLNLRHRRLLSRGEECKSAPGGCLERNPPACWPVQGSRHCIVKSRAFVQPAAAR